MLHDWHEGIRKQVTGVVNAIPPPHSALCSPKTVDKTFIKFIISQFTDHLKYSGVYEISRECDNMYKGMAKQNLKNNVKAYKRLQNIKFDVWFIQTSRKQYKLFSHYLQDRSRQVPYHSKNPPLNTDRSNLNITCFHSQIPDLNMISNTHPNPNYEQQFTQKLFSECTYLVTLIMLRSLPKPIYVCTLLTFFSPFFYNLFYVYNSSSSSVETTKSLKNYN